MENRYPPRVSIRKAEKGGVFLEYARGYRYGQKHPMPGHSITAEQEDLIDLFNRIPDGSTEYLSKEEFDAIVKPLVEALEKVSVIRFPDIPVGGEDLALVCAQNNMRIAKEALENYKKQIGEKDE